MPTNVGKGPTGDQSAVPARVPRQHTDGNGSSIEQQVTQLAQTVDALLQFVNNTFAPATPSRVSGGSNSVTTTVPNQGDLNLRGAINPDLNVRRNITAGNSLRVNKGLTSTSPAYIVDATGKQISSGPYDVTGNSVVRGNLQITGTVTPNATPPATASFAAFDAGGPMQLFGAGEDPAPGPMQYADPNGPESLGSLTVDGPTQINNNLAVTAPATFSDITSSGMINADMLAVNGTQIATDQQVTNNSTVSGNSYVGGDFHVDGGAYFGAGGGQGSNDPNALAYASVVDGTINGVTITASATLTGANIVTAGDVQAATAHIANGSITTITGTNAAYTNGTFNNLSAGTISSNGSPIITNGNITATDVSTVTLAASGASTLKAVTVTSLSSTGAISASGALSGATLTVSGASSLQNVTASGTLAVTGATTLTGGATISGGATVNGAVLANNGIVTNDILTGTFNSTAAASIGTNLSVGGTGTFIGAVTTPNILAAAGYLTSLKEAQYWDTAYLANTNKLMNSPVIWNVSGNNGLLGTGLGGSAYAAVTDWAYVPPVNGSLHSITGYIYTNTAATVTIALYVNGTSAFSGNITTTAATRKYMALVSTRGTLPFTAGSYLQLFIKSSVNQTNFYATLAPHVYL